MSPPWWVLGHPGASPQESSTQIWEQNPPYGDHPCIPHRHQIPQIPGGAPCLASTPNPGQTPRDSPDGDIFRAGHLQRSPFGATLLPPARRGPSRMRPGGGPSIPGGLRASFLAGSRGGEAGAGRAAGPKPPDGNIWLVPRCGFRALLPSGLPCFVRGRAGRPPRPPPSCCRAPSPKNSPRAGADGGRVRARRCPGGPGALANPNAPTPGFTFTSRHLLRRFGDDVPRGPSICSRGRVAAGCPQVAGLRPPCSSSRLILAPNPFFSTQTTLADGRTGR